MNDSRTLTGLAFIEKCLDRLRLHDKVES